MGKKLERVIDGGEQGVHFEADEGADVDNVTVGLGNGEMDKFVDEKNLENGRADVGAKDFNTDENVHTEDENHNLRNAVTENGSTSHLSFKENNLNKIIRNENENEIQECEEFKPGKSSKFMVAEFDVERVIVEQETHDLYCPNCHSCITKRVILRKRKRPYRENQSGLPPQKVQHVPEASSAPNETVDHEDETVFRCLSCFSFFIPTESGFNIFRIFGKKDGSNNFQSSGKIPAKNVNWVSSLFGSDSSRNKGNHGDPLLAETNRVSTGEPSLGLKGKSPCVPTTGATDIGEKGIIIGVNNTDHLAGGQMGQVEKQSYVATTESRDPSAGESKSSGRQIGNHAQRDMQSYPATTVSNAGQSSSKGGLLGNQAQEDIQSDPQTIVSKDPLAGESYHNGGPMGNHAQGNEKSYSATTISKDHLAGGQMGDQTQAEKQSYMATTESRDPSDGESKSSGGHTGNQAQQDMQSYPAITVSEDQLAGQSYSNGGLLGNQAQEDKQSGPQTTASKDPLAGESYCNGGPIGNHAQGDEKSYSATTIAEDTLSGVSHTKGGQMGIRTQGDNQGHLAPAILKGNEPFGMVKPTSSIGTTESNQYIHVPENSDAAETRIDVAMRGVEESGRGNDWDVLKSVVYGGLIESITSLCVVSSAAGSGASTTHVCALGLANLIGGLFLIAHDLSELQSEHDEEATNRRDQQSGQYWNKLGKREHFQRHAVVSILSYIVFGLLPPVIYGFTFGKCNINKEYKIIAVSSSSLLFVALLAIGKAHVRPQKNYIRSLLYFLAIALPASGLSYVAGVMINRFLVELGLFFPSGAPPPPPSSIELSSFGSNTPLWADF